MLEKIETRNVQCHHRFCFFFPRVEEPRPAARPLLPRSAFVARPLVGFGDSLTKTEYGTLTGNTREQEKKTDQMKPPSSLYPPRHHLQSFHLRLFL